METTLARLIAGTEIDRSRRWLENAHRDGKAGTGWPHRTDQPYPTEWGGTADPIWALAHSGTSTNDPILTKSFEWLLSKQRGDGGFGSREITYSCVEVTSWVLLAARALGRMGESKIKQAIAFLESAQNADGGFGTAKGDASRTYPSLITARALHGHSNASIPAARLVLSRRNPDTGGWGFELDPQARTTASSTAQALVILTELELIAHGDVVGKAAVEWLIANQLPDGSWENEFETWFSAQQAAPNRHEEFTTAWAVQALVKRGVPPNAGSLVLAVNWLLQRQLPDGRWVFDHREPDAEHIWCVSNGLVALSIARQHARQKLDEEGAGALTLPRNVTPDVEAGSIRQAAEFLRANTHSLLISALAVWVFRGEIAATVAWSLGLIPQYSTDLLVGIASNAAYAIIFVLVLWVIRAVTRQRKGNDGKE